jgi:hypothetical protein
MSDPWEIPPLPARGDSSVRTTHVTRSQALDAWEWLEVCLWVLDGLFAQGGSGGTGSYGEGTTFVRRIDKLEKEADRYFKKNPDQTKEAEFAILACHLRQFASRRHDIAHGIVQPYLSSDNLNLSVIEFAVLPAFYIITRKNGDHFPNYAYNEQILWDFCQHFERLGKNTRDFMRTIFPSAPELSQKP